MPNKFQNILEFGGINISGSQDNIPDIDASDCDSIDFSLDGLMSVNSGKQVLGTEIANITGTPEDTSLYIFKKAFGRQKEVLVRSTRISGNYKLQWFTGSDWKLISTENYNNGKFSYANGNGDSGRSINRLFISNGYNNVATWSGATTTVTSFTTNSITASSDLLSEGFEVNPYGIANFVLINNVEFGYTGISGNTFTGVTTDPFTTSIAVADGIASQVEDRLSRESLLQSYKISFNQVGLTGNNIIRSDTSIDFLTNTNIQLGQRIFVSGFAATGNNKIYTVKSITSTTITFEDNEVGQLSEVAGKLITVSAGVPKGNILRVDNAKLYVAGVTGQENTLNYSVTNDLTNFAITAESKLTDGGYFTFFQGGSNITALWPRGDNRIVVHKTDGIFSYNLNIDSTNKVYATIDILSLGYGVGAVNNNAITSYDKSTYYLNGANEIKVMEQSVYNTATFNFDTIVEQTKYLSITGKPYLVYDNKKSRLVLSFNLNKGNHTSSFAYNYLLSIFIKKTAQGRSYKLSMDNIPLSAITTVATVMPMVYINKLIGASGSINTSLSDNLLVYIGITGNVYAIGKRVTTITNSKPYWVSKEFTFGEPAQSKEFDIINIDGYLYNTTKIRISVLYGVNGSDGVKHYVFDKNTANTNNDAIVDTTTIGNKDYGLLGENSIFNNDNFSLYQQSQYFKIPLHIDIKKSDRYKIRIESYAPTANDLNGSWWAINNISTNVVLKDVDMNRIVNQNEAGVNGVGTDVVAYTNVGYGIS